MSLENFPKTNFDSLLEQMENKGFHYHGVENLFETNFKGVAADNPDDRFKFVTEQVQTKEGLIDSVKNLPEFAEVKDKLEIELIQAPSKQETYYVFVKVSE